MSHLAVRKPMSIAIDPTSLHAPLAGAPRATRDWSVAAMGAPSVTLVCCVESGRLEPMTLRMIESLRRFGGAFADCPVVAVKPRLGPPLTAATRQGLERWNVRYEQLPVRRRYGWYNFMNKPVTLATLQNELDTESVAWLDSDVLFLNEPLEYRLGDDEDAIVCVPDRGVIGTTGPDDPFDTYWAAVCGVLGLELEALPWVTSQVDGQRIRFYCNGGIFLYRRSTGFAQTYLRTCRKLMDERLRFAWSGVYWLEQMAVGLSMLLHGLRIRVMPDTHDYTVMVKLHERCGQPSFGQVRVLHYHDAMSPSFFDTLLSYLEQAHPSVYAWLTRQAPIADPSSRPARAMQLVLRGARRAAREWHLRRCRVVRNPKDP